MRAREAPPMKKPGRWWHLSGFLHVGGGSRIRTYDLLIKSQLLYQLSYTPWAMVETRRIELPTFALRTRRSPS